MLSPPRLSSYGRWNRRCIGRCWMRGRRARTRSRSWLQSLLLRLLGAAAMRTSASFGGSGGKDARDLRDNISEWLDGVSEPTSPDGRDTADGGVNDVPSDPGTAHQPNERPQ